MSEIQFNYVCFNNKSLQRININPFDLFSFKTFQICKVKQYKQHSMFYDQLNKEIIIYYYMYIQTKVMVHHQLDLLHKIKIFFIYRQNYCRTIYSTFTS